LKRIAVGVTFSQKTVSKTCFCENMEKSEMKRDKNIRQWFQTFCTVSQCRNPL